MGVIVDISDFKGRNFIATNSYNQNGLDELIDSVEIDVLSRLFGSDMATDFISDINNGAPQNPLYLDIFNPLSVQVGRNVLVSEGIKKMITYFVYAEFNVDSSSRSTNEGRKVMSGENSESLKTASLKRYNEGILTARAIQAYIRKNSTDYPLYKGVYFQTVNPIW